MNKHLICIIILWLSCHVNTWADELNFPVKENLGTSFITQEKIFNKSTGKDILHFSFPGDSQEYSLEIKATVNAAKGRGLDVDVRNTLGKGFRTSMNADKFGWTAPLSNFQHFSGINTGQEYTFRYVVKNGTVYIYQDALFLSSETLTNIGDINDSDEEFFDFTYNNNDIIGEWAGTNISGKGKPTEYGWSNSAIQLSDGLWQIANAGSGVRFIDVEGKNPIHTLDGNTYSGRLLTIRYEGNLASSVFSYPVTLEANSNYEFSFIYEHWNNGEIGAQLTSGISTSRTSTGIFDSKSFTTVAKNTLQKGVFRFTSGEAGQYYITFSGASGTMFAIGELSLKKYETPEPRIIFGKNYTEGDIDMKITSATFEEGAYAPFFDNTGDITINNRNYTTTAIHNKNLIIQGVAEVHLTGENPIENATIDLQSEDSWLFIEEVKPSNVISNYLSSIMVNGQPFTRGTNGRVAIYAHGTVLMPHPSAFKPLTVFTEENYGGKDSQYNLHTHHNNLGDFDNTIKSIKLKRGYMATFANNSDGTGYSRTFIADTEDIEIPVMPAPLYESISFIRVFRHEWVTKKGWAGGQNEADILDCTWNYDWSAGGTTSSNIEFVPDKHNGGWPAWNDINNKTGVTHLMGYNEPDRSDQSNISFANAIANQPQFYTSGLRVTSPVTSDFYNGWGQGAFIASCDTLNYRMDISNIHAYQPKSWWSYGRMDDLSSRSNNRPLWFTEWNNGANWTNESWPNAKSLSTDANMNKQLEDIIFILDILDRHPKVERYSIYNWVEDMRAMILTINSDWKSRNPNWQNYEWLKTAPVVGKDNGADIVLTPAGQYYKKNKAPLAYNKDSEIIPQWVVPYVELKASLYTDNKTVVFTWATKKDELISYILEIKEEGDTNFREISTMDYTETRLIETIGKSAQYRLKIVPRENLLLSPRYSNIVSVEVDILQGPPVLRGKVLSESEIQLSWNQVDKARTYTLKRSTELDGKYTIILNKTSLLSYTDKNLSGNTTYYYKISSNNYAGEGNESEALVLKTGSSGTGLNDQAYNEVYCFNNQLVFKEYQNYNFTLYSIGGAVLKKFFITESNQVFDLHLPKGTYILKGCNGVQTFENKIFIK